MMTHEANPALTPRLMLNEVRMQANIRRMQTHLSSAGVVVRPHIKTAKCLAVIEQMVAGEAAPRLTVSTLREASEMLAAGYKDVLYAVGAVPQKLPELQRLAVRFGARVSVILDSVEVAQALVASSRGVGEFALDAFIELDVDGHRAGVDPASNALLEIARVLCSSDGQGAGSGLLRGVMTHAGGAYNCRGRAELEAMSERERAGAVLAAQRLRGAGMDVFEVSIGSTPTVLVAQSFEGVTEVRVGVYVFNDLVMAGLGVCDQKDIALSVSTTVIGHQPQRNTLIVDAGWMALSSDRSTGGFPLDQGLGLVLRTIEKPGEEPGKEPDQQLIVASANQEHGLVVPRTGGPLRLERYPIGTQLRILPIHACATAAQFEGYQVEGEGTEPRFWRRFGGW